MTLSYADTGLKLITYQHSTFVLACFTLSSPSVGTPIRKQGSVLAPEFKRDLPWYLPFLAFAPQAIERPLVVD